MEKKLRVVTVLKGGGDYNANHVYALEGMVHKYLNADFLCLSDQHLLCEHKALRHGWPGWWSKMEIFRLEPPVLYLDLDTIICGHANDILESAKGHDFVILRDVYRGRSDPNAMQSSIMYWERDMFWLYDAFREQPVFDLPHGDQEFLEQEVAVAHYWQDLTPSIVSYKADIISGGFKPHHKIVIFHGKPRPWEQDLIAYPS